MLVFQKPNKVYRDEIDENPTLGNSKKKVKSERRKSLCNGILLYLWHNKSFGDFEKKYI